MLQTNGECVVYLANLTRSNTYFIF